MKTLFFAIRTIAVVVLFALFVVCLLGILAFYMEPLALVFAAGSSISFAGFLFLLS